MYLIILQMGGNFRQRIYQCLPSHLKSLSNKAQRPPFLSSNFLKSCQPHSECLLENFTKAKENTKDETAADQGKRGGEPRGHRASL
jgi:hypothetical protein